MIDFGRPIPPSPAASAALIEAFAERDIEWHPRREVCELDPARKVAIAARRRRDALRPVPRPSPSTGRPAVVVEAGLTETAGSRWTR